MKIPPLIFSTVPTNWYNFRVTKIDEGIQTKFGEALRFTFQILDGEFQGETVDNLVSVKRDGMGKGAKLSKWYVALVGPIPEDGFDPMDMLHKCGRMNVLESEPTPGNFRNEILSIEPPAAPQRPSGRVPRAPVPTTPQEEDEPPF